MNDFRKVMLQVQPWIYRNARPLDLFRWRYFFEDQTPDAANAFREDILQSLAVYQNDDGGFGHALEPDSWNPGSSPMTTWAATEVLAELGALSVNHPLIRGILRYLASDRDFDGMFWRAEVPGNNDHPHAPWWHFDAATVDNWGYNPTASLAGFVILHASPDMPMRQKAGALVRNMAADLTASETKHDMHEVACIIRMAEYCQQAGAADLFEADALRRWLASQVSRLITRNLNDWTGGYVCMPSRFIRSPKSPFYPGNEAAVAAEAEYLLRTLPDGDVWPITWKWGQYDQAFAVSQNWWKSEIAIRNLLFLQAFLPG